MKSHCLRVLYTLSVLGIMTVALFFAVGVFADDHNSVDLSPSVLWEGEEITQPVVGEFLTAALVADDPTGMSWQWARSQDGEGGWEDIEAATSTKYIPTGGDVGHYLRATVSYTDGDGNTQSAEAITTDQVEQERSGVRCPYCDPLLQQTQTAAATPPTPEPTQEPTCGNGPQPDCPTPTRYPDPPPTPHPTIT